MRSRACCSSGTCPRMQKGLLLRPPLWVLPGGLAVCCDFYEGSVPYRRVERLENVYWCFLCDLC